MTTYRWTPGAQVKADAQAVGEYLLALQGAHSERLTPRVVVDAARSKKSPLHQCFEWDDVRAGELFRESQARLILRSIRVVEFDWKQDAEVERRVFVNVVETVGNERQNAYVPISRVLNNQELRHQLILQARKELQAFKRRYVEITELMDIVDNALAKVQESLLPAEAKEGAA